MVKLFKLFKGTEAVVKAMSERDVIQRKLEALEEDQSVRSKLGEGYGDSEEVVVFKLNPVYQKAEGQRGWKYQVLLEQPDGKALDFGYNNKARQLADFVVQRNGHLISD